jgi:hypothetical protein
MKPTLPCAALLDLRKDTASLAQLEDLEELVNVPVQRGGVYFSDWERGFIASMGGIEPPVFSQAQRDKISEIWQAVDLRKRGAPDEKSANLFSKLSPERQAEQRERASRVRLPWEK